MGILRFTTAGSVDDGKSTLIGRLLYDTGNIKDDILQSAGNNEDTGINLAYLTDGLRAEREQGITIDVAYKYFSTKGRKYIITDAPGHFQYTRNLVTGASGVDAMIVLIDAVNGITAQSRRHLLVASFLGIRHIAIAVNKMDIVQYSEGVFTAIKNELQGLAAILQLPELIFIPVSALEGENVAAKQQLIAWYNGPCLLEYLENCNPEPAGNNPARFSIQYVLHSREAGFEKGYAGKMLSGSISVGDTVCVYPGMHSLVISKILNGSTVCGEAQTGENICLYFTERMELSRGHIVTHFTEPPRYAKTFEATLCWLYEMEPMAIGKEYLLRINAMETKCKVVSVLYIIDNDTFTKVAGSSVGVNQFAKVQIETTENIAFDRFNGLPELGRGILIDMHTNGTAGAFIIG